MTLLLKKPFGIDTGDAISLRHDGRALDRARVYHLMMSYGCHPPTSERVVLCLLHSRRYDCVLQTGWFRTWYQTFCDECADLGITVHVVKLHPGDRTPLNKATTRSKPGPFRIVA